MTTITQADYDTAQALARRMGGRFVLDEGVTIAPPEPPEAMVKLAETACKAALASIDDSPCASWQQGYLAALQFADLKVCEVGADEGDPYAGMLKVAVERVIAAIRRKLGAIA